jgi:isopropylmalate/homocitrate/citramalate synthase
VAVRWDAAPSLTLRASAGSGFRAPDFRELYLRFVNESAGYAIYGNEDLAPERSRNLSIGAEWSIDAGYVRTQLFHNRFDGFIEEALVSAPDEPLVFIYQNVDDGYTRGVEIEGAVSTAFGCTMQGDVPEDDVVSIASKLAEFCDAVALADTVGYANPAQVKRLFAKVRSRIGEKLEGAHFHNTRGLGIANALAAYEEGVRNFDSSMGGLGGCPFAPGASGNVITEDLVFMFESMGVTTGRHLEALFKAREHILKAIPEEPLYGHTPLAGLPKGFRAAA